jgi:hypothetical protein
MKKKKKLSLEFPIAWFYLVRGDLLSSEKTSFPQSNIHANYNLKSHVTIATEQI